MVEYPTFNRGVRDSISRERTMPGSTTTAIYGLLAQLVEQRTVNPWAAGSNPAQPAICSSGETGKRGGFMSRFNLGSTPSWSIYMGV